MLELWGMRSTPSLPLLPGSLWPRVVAPDSVLCMGQIEINWISWNITVVTFNPGFPDHWWTLYPLDQWASSDRVIPKTLKMVLDTPLLNTQRYKVRFKGKVEQSRERCSAPLHLGVVAIEMGAFWLPSTKVANPACLLTFKLRTHTKLNCSK